MTEVERDIRVVIIGLGLIGGSLARSLRGRWNRLQRLVALDTDRASLNGRRIRVWLMLSTICRHSVSAQIRRQVDSTHLLHKVRLICSCITNCQKQLRMNLPKRILSVAAPLGYIPSIMGIVTKVTPALLTDGKCQNNCVRTGRALPLDWWSSHGWF